MLAVLRHLARILQADQRAEAQRVRRVVVRETVWYICSALHAAIGLGNGSGCRGIRRAGREVFVEILGMTLEETSRRMLLVVYDLYER